MFTGDQTKNASQGGEDQGAPHHFDSRGAGVTSNSPQVLVVDDDPQLLNIVGRFLRREGYSVASYKAMAPALESLASLRNNTGVILADLDLPDGWGTDFLSAIGHLPDFRPKPTVVLMTGKGSVESAVDAMRRGAYDYLLKPFDEPRELVQVVARAMERYCLLSRNRNLELKMAATGSSPPPLYFSEVMRGIEDLAARVAPTRSTVLITGESGTGKEVLARRIHELSQRCDGPFVAVNCGALTASLQESELFGHARGSFTGATSAHRGLFEQAHRGTLLLDEVGELSPSTQVLLLRVLQEGVVRPVGATTDVPVDVRVLAATHRDLREMLLGDRFRQDLYYRLNVFELRVPPLRERRDDIVPLVQHFLKEHSERMQIPTPHVTAEVLETLTSHDWPGNVRELQNAVERALILCRNGEVTLSCLPHPVRKQSSGKPPLPPQPPLAEARSSFERRYLEDLMQQSEGNLSEAARRSGVDRSNLRRLIKRHKLEY